MLFLILKVSLLSFPRAGHRVQKERIDLQVRMLHRIFWFDDIVPVKPGQKIINRPYPIQHHPTQFHPALQNS